MEKYKMIKDDKGNFIADDFSHGKNFEIGYYNVIHRGCKVGDNVKICSFVELRSNTIIGDNVYVDTGVKSSGNNSIGSNVTLRFDAIIAREVTIEDDVFISPQVMTIYSDHQGKKHPGTVIGKGTFIGTNVTLNHGVKIAHQTVVGSKALVVNNLEEPGIYVGVPAKKLEKKGKIKAVRYRA